MKDITDAKNYYLCSRKEFSAYLSMPPQGSCVINRFKRPDLQGLIGKEFIPVNEMNYLRLYNYDLYRMLYLNAEIVDEKTQYVIAGTRGELSTASYEEVVANYRWSSGLDINYAGVLGRSISIRFGIRVDNLIPGDGIMMRWQLIESKLPDNIFAMACFIPKWDKLMLNIGSSIININDDRVMHGHGDYLVCPISNDSKADTRRLTLINGLVFADMYDSEKHQPNMSKSTSRYYGALPDII